MSLRKKIIIGILAVFIPLAIGAGVFFAYRLGWIKSGNANPKEYMYSVGDFTVNLNDPSYKRYIKVTVFIGSTSKKLDAELEEKMPKVRDTINDILRSKKIEDVNTPVKTEVVKKEIRDKINFIFTDGKITNIYLNDILIQ